MYKHLDKQRVPREEEFKVILLYSEFHDSQSDTEKFCLEKHTLMKKKSSQTGEIIGYKCWIW